MASINRKSEIEVQTDIVPPSRRSSVILKRLFSTDSSASSSKFTYELYPSANYEYSLCGKEFLLKISQLLIAVIGIGLYSSALGAMHCSMMSRMFPNTVFSSFIIITSVIAMSYVLGQVMPEMLIRIFNAIAMILYLVLTWITGYVWYDVARHLKIEDEIYSAKMLLAQVVISSVNVVLYAVDLGLSVRTALTGL